MIEVLISGLTFGGLAWNRWHADRAGVTLPDSLRVNCRTAAEDAMPEPRGRRIRTCPGELIVHDDGTTECHGGRPGCRGIGDNDHGRVRVCRCSHPGLTEPDLTPAEGLTEPDLTPAEGGDPP